MSCTPPSNKNNIVTGQVTEVPPSAGGVSSLGAAEDFVVEDDEDVGRFVAVHGDQDEEDDDEEPYSEFEIFGLNSNTSGRSCNLHECCGSQVTVGDIVRLKKTLVDLDHGTEEAVACILVRRGRETCTVAYVPRALLHWQSIAEHINKHAQIVEMYVMSRNTHKRRKCHLNMGVAGCVFIDEIPQDE
jgi:hypothetical protein